MKQAPGCDRLSFDPFSLLQDGLVSPEVDIGRSEVLQALAIAPVVVVLDVGVDLMPEIARKILVFRHNAVLQDLVPTFDFTLGLGVIGCAADMIHLPIFLPVGQFAQNVTVAGVGEQRIN